MRSTLVLTHAPRRPQANLAEEVAARAETQRMLATMAADVEKLKAELHSVTGRPGTASGAPRRAK